MTAGGAVVKATPGTVVTRPANGTFCITVPGATPASSAIVATPDFDNDSTGSSVTPGSAWTKAYTEVRTTGACGAGAFEVVTMVQSYDGATKVTSLVYSYQGFQFLIA